MGPNFFARLAPTLLPWCFARWPQYHAGCGSLHLEGLQRRVVEAGARLGRAFDGDADRALSFAKTEKS